MSATPPADIVLEHLRAIRASLTRLDDDRREDRGRLTNIEGGFAALSSQLGHVLSVLAEVRVAIDRQSDRLDRIERRLDLVEHD